ncbi:hypothetical protein ABDK00_009895 [Niabella insulamsoli]|uniref:hypothetical protein n=1 Tax=Niabella insulamsoli TaxID=3144874 RepID=UPI0031FBD1D0
MKKKLLLFLFGIALSGLLFSQTIENKLAAWSSTNPVEKLYLHLDRDSYFAGQTIWFKGYFLSAWAPSHKNSTVYVELVNNQQEVLIRNVFPANLSVTAGQVELPEDLPGGDYLLRAYSPLMLNQPGFVFTKKLAVFGREEKKKKREAVKMENSITFFPESGNLITSLLNLVAFKATDPNGLPWQVEGEIKSDKGELVCQFKTIHDGMGVFPLIPQAGVSYYATLRGSDRQYPLPAQTADGIAFMVKNNARGKQFRIQKLQVKDVFKPAFLVGQMNNEILFTHELANKNEINGIIPTKDLLSGILHLTVFNKDYMPLAERLTFVDNREYRLPVTLQTDTLNMEPRQRNRFTISLPDSVVGNFSVAVTDADYDGAARRAQNIYSWFLLKSDIKGYVHNPAYYFNPTDSAASNALDLVMMTNGWTRFKWTDVPQNKLPPPAFKDPGYIDLSGQITIEGRKKTLPNTDIIVLMSPMDTTQRRGLPGLIRTDSTGRFKLDSQIFYDKYRILFSEVRGKKSKFIEVKLASDSIRRKFPVVSDPLLLPLDSAQLVSSEKMESALDEYLRAEGKTLENVVVRVRQKSEIEKLDERYTSSLFSGGINSRTYDVRNEIFAGDIFQYLQGRIPGLSVTGTPGNYTLNYRGGGFGGSNVSLFLDEMQTDAQMLESIPVNQIAMIKLMPQSVAVRGNGTGLAIYTKKGDDYTASVESATDIITYNGYTIFKEFHNPNYDKNPNTEKADIRLTLSWQPSHFVSPARPNIPIIFYNNDRTQKVKVVAEGITEDGRMLMFEKIIEPGQN